jgi:hypothetical protein
MAEENGRGFLDYLIPCSCLCFLSVPFAVAAAFVAAAAPNYLSHCSAVLPDVGSNAGSEIHGNPGIKVPLQEPTKPGLMLFSMDIPYESYANSKGQFALQ